MKTSIRFIFFLWILVVTFGLPVRGQFFFPGGLDVYTTGLIPDGSDLNEIIVRDGTGRDKRQYRATDPRDLHNAKIFLKQISAVAVANGVLYAAAETSKFAVLKNLKFTLIQPEGQTAPALAATVPGATQEAPVVVPISNDADSFVLSPDGRYAVVVGTDVSEPESTATPVSLVDISLGSEVSKLVIPGRAGSYAYVAVCDDAVTVLALIGPAVHRLMITADGQLMDTGDAFSLPAGASNFLRVVAVPGSKVGVTLSQFPPKLCTFSIPGMLPLDSVSVSGGSGDGLAVAPDGTKVYSRGGYPVGEIDCFTLDPVTGLLGDTSFLTVPNVSPAHIGIFGNALAVTADGAHLIACESAFPATADVPTPRVTFFDAVTGARGDFFESANAPMLLAIEPPGPPRGVNTLLFKKGDPAPGADGATGKPPADALLASFGVPAIDEDGNVAFTAQWTSATAKKGKGLFTDASSIAIVGGTVPGVSGAAFKSFMDPLIDGGHVACLTTLAGVPKGMSSAVLSDAPSGALAVIARTGATAPGADGAVFKKFEEIGLDGTSVGFLADLKTSSATDRGLWAADATHSLTLLLREGQTVAGQTIKTLLSFKVGNGSPGQGRGWLLSPASGTQALALVIFTGKAQAVVAAGIDGTVTVLSQSGPAGAGGPDLAEANFASYGVPAVNAAAHSSFLGTLAIGPGGVAKGDARGVFANFGAALYTSIARTGDMAGATGSTFDTFKDPVIAADDTLGFYATIKGGGAKGSRVKTLWAQAPGGALSLVAQGGANATGTAGQWKDFTSLAVVAGQGPLFSATLAAGKGGLTASNAKGVWEANSRGVTRLLFRTGDEVDGVKVKDFTALTALPGSMGMSHSFNASGEVVWRAAFPDRSTAIVKTKAP